MVVHYPLNELLLSWTHIAALRPLQPAKQGLTGREVARLAGLHHRTCLKALTALEALSVVRRQRGGRDHLFSLNREHVLVQSILLPALNAERDFHKNLFALIAKTCRKYCLSIVVFGSVARREETVESDLDICLLVETSNEGTIAQDRLNEIAPQVHHLFGAKLAPLVVTRNEFIRKAKKGQSPVKDIVKEGIVIEGIELEGVLRGKK